MLHAAIERHDSPGTIVTGGAGVFKANRVKAVYRSLGIRKKEIEKRKPWQSFIETTFNIQRRMADFRFGRAKTWEDLVAAHDLWLLSYNAQCLWAHEGRKGGRRSPSEVLGSLTLLRHHPEDLSRVFFSTRFLRRLDVLGYARLKRWRVYGEEGLARCQVALWLGDGGLVVWSTLGTRSVALRRLLLPRRDEAGKCDQPAPVRHEAPSPAAQALRARRGVG